MAEGEKVGLGLSHVSVLKHDQVLFDQWVSTVGTALSAYHWNGPVQLVADNFVVFSEQEKTAFVCEGTHTMVIVHREPGSIEQPDISVSS